MNVPANNGMSRLDTLTGGSNCTNLVLRQTGSAANVNQIANASSCTNTLNNAGTLTSVPIVAATTF